MTRCSTSRSCCCSSRSAIALIAFYESPLPGIGVSFSNLITDQTGYFQSVLEARSFDNIYRHFDTLSEHFMQPDPWSILANLIYWTVLLLIAFAKAVSLAVIAFGLIASAVCGLLGPIFVPFFIVPKLDWLFWGWLRSFIQYSFVPVVAIAFLMIFEQFVFRYITTLPPMITQAEYGVYALQAFAVVATFCMGILLGSVAHAVDLLRLQRRERAGQPDQRQPRVLRGADGGHVMSRRWPSGRTHEEEQPASTELSRLLVMGFLIAALLGLLTGDCLDRLEPAQAISSAAREALRS